MSDFVNFWLPLGLMVVFGYAFHRIFLDLLFGPSPKRFRVGQVVEDKYHGRGLWVVVKAGPMLARKKKWGEYTWQEVTLTPVVRVDGGYAFPQERPMTPILHRQDRNPYDLHDLFPAVGRMKVGVWPDWVTFDQPQ